MTPTSPSPERGAKRVYWEDPVMAMPDDDLIRHMDRLHTELALKQCDVAEQMLSWLLADKLFDLTGDMFWDAVADVEKTVLEHELKIFDDPLTQFLRMPPLPTEFTPGVIGIKE